MKSQPTSKFPLSYIPDPKNNRMRGAGSVQKAREFYFAQHRPILIELLKGRYEWMNAYLDGKPSVYELGAGSGFSREFITNPNLKLTDVEERPWVDQVVDALKLPFPENSVDALVVSHAIHHLAYPSLFLEQAIRTLKPGGVIVISDLHLSPFLKILLLVMRHEGWSYASDPFDSLSPANDPRDPWSANCAIPKILFSDPDRFHAHFPKATIEKYELVEGFLLPLSGGGNSQDLFTPDTELGAPMD